MVSGGSDPAAVAYSASPSVPAFIAKLWALVEAEATNTVVKWSESGNSFFIYDANALSKELLPQYFKHNNYSSFIRQLNMYGFRKVMTIDQGALQSDHRDESEFQNSYFIRGRPELLVHLKRRAAANSASAQNVQITAVRQAATLDQAEMDDKVATLESKLHRLQATQDALNEQFLHLKRENTTLWQELANQRQKHLKQQQVTYKLLQFIMHTLVPNATASARNGGGNHHHRTTIHLGKRKLPALMQTDAEDDGVDGGDIKRVLMGASSAAASSSSSIEPSSSSSASLTSVPPSSSSPSGAASIFAPNASHLHQRVTSGPIISEISHRQSPEPSTSSLAVGNNFAFGHPTELASSSSSSPSPSPPASILHTSALIGSPMQSVFSVVDGVPVLTQKAIAPFHPTRNNNEQVTSINNVTDNADLKKKLNQKTSTTTATSIGSAPIDLSSLQTVVMPDGSTVYLLPSTITQNLPSSSSASSLANSTLATIAASSGITPTIASSTNPQIISDGGILPTRSSTPLQNANPGSSSVVGSSRKVGRSSSCSGSTGSTVTGAPIVTSPSGAILRSPAITSYHSRSLLNKTLQDKSPSKSVSGKATKKSAITPSMPYLVPVASTGPAPSASPSISTTKHVASSGNAAMSTKPSSNSPRPVATSILTSASSPDDFFAHLDEKIVGGDVSAVGGSSASSAATRSTDVVEPPSFVDVYGLHSRDSGAQDVGDRANSSPGIDAAFHLKDALLTPTLESFDSSNIVNEGASSSSMSLLPSADVGASSSSLSLLPTSMNPHQNLALSLSKQIESVDAGLDSIKDSLVSHSSDLQVDPSELLNMFMTDSAAGNFTTTPGSPMRWDDLLDLSNSAKDALSLALGPQRTIMGPPGMMEDDDDEEEEEGKA